MSVEVPVENDGTETNQNSEENVCDLCGVSYETKRGLTQHKRLTHPVEYNEGLNVERKKDRWNDEEMRLMAKHEVDAIRDNERFINQYILGKMSNRSLEAIKGMRKQAKYKRLVNEIMNGPSQPEEGQEVNGQEDQNQRGEEAPDYVMNIRNEVEKSVRLLQSSRNRHSRTLLTLARRILDGDVNGNQLTNWMKSVFGNNNRPNGPNTEREQSAGAISNRERRRREYAKLQKLYKKDLGAAIRSVLRGTDDNVTYPSREETEAFWKNVFEETPDTSHGINVAPEAKKELEGLWKPICIEDIRLSELDIDSAAGPDRVSVAKWRSTSYETKRLFFNLIMLKGRLEEGLNKARTVLIPKKKGSLRPEDFRPISITSVAVRQLHKMFAQRLRRLHHFDERQRAFIEYDGTMENLSIVSALLSDAKMSKKKIYMATLDLKKAFDSVSHRTIIDTIKQMGCPGPFIHYMENLYGNATTTLQYEGHEAPIKINKGVLQGDPISPMVFNAVMDRAMRKLNNDIGYRMNGRVFNCIAYADDIILVASTQNGLQVLINTIEDELSLFGLEINSGKSSTLSLVPSVKDRVMKTITQQAFKANGSPLKAIGVLDSWKYLGIEFIGSKIGNSKVDMTDDLIKVDKAPLKPQQRVKMLTTGIIPKYLHSLILGKTNAGRLEAIDANIRKYVRKWLHLPNDTPLAYFYTRVKSGGLGIPRLRESVPMNKLKRIEKLLVVDGNTNRAFARSVYIDGQIKWCKEMLSHLGTNITKEEQARQWMRKMEEKVDLKNVTLSRYSKASTMWVCEKANDISGRDFVHYNQIRAGTLPSKSRTRRGRPLERRCRAGCQCPETNYHIIQQCHRTHGGRVLRHDRVVTFVKDFIEEANGEATVLKEQRFQTLEGLQKPDLLITINGSTTLVDVQIVSGNNMETDHRRKCDRYKSVQGLEHMIMNKCRSGDVSYEAITISYKGIIEKQTDKLLKCLGITNNQKHILVTSVLRGTWLNWHRFNRMTTMAGS